MQKTQKLFKFQDKKLVLDPHLMWGSEKACHLKLKFPKTNQKGFTFFELLVVIGIIAILIILVIFALYPARRFAEARNSRRWADINNILTAVHEHIVDQEQYPAGLEKNTPKTEIGSCAECVNLSAPLAPYLIYLPKEMIGGTLQNTGYKIRVNENGIVTVFAPGAENNKTIEVSR